MIPYLYNDIIRLLHSILQVVVNQEVIDDCTSGQDLLKIDTSKDENFKKGKDYLLGFSAEHMVVELQKKDCDIKALHENVRLCVVTAKIFERCPVKSVLLRNAVVFKPTSMFTNKKETLLKKLKKLLMYLVTMSLVNTSSADKVSDQYTQLLKDDIAKLDQDAEIGRLDHFFFQQLNVVKKYPELAQVISILLSLSHGQADIERGFSQNKRVLQHNIQENSIRSKRLILDHMVSNNLQPDTIKVSNDMLKAVRAARTKYMIHMEEQKKEKNNNIKETQKDILKLKSKI